MAEVSNPVERLRCRDELLQILFWLSGEGFQSDMTADGICRFTEWSREEIERALDDAADAGLVEPLGGGRYDLSPQGRREGGRRFLDEFAHIRARDTHGGGCSDPDCDCHSGAGAPCIHEHHEGQHQ